MPIRLSKDYGFPFPLQTRSNHNSWVKHNLYGRSFIFTWLICSAMYPWRLPRTIIIMPYWRDLLLQKSISKLSKTLLRHKAILNPVILQPTGYDPINGQPQLYWQGSIFIAVIG